MTVAEGGGKRAVQHKLRDMYLPTLKANFMVWPLVQIINFRLMPIQFQLVSLFSTILPVHLLIHYSHSSLLLVSPGLHTCLCPTQQKMPLHLSQELLLLESRQFTWRRQHVVTLQKTVE